MRRTGSATRGVLGDTVLALWDVGTRQSTGLLGPRPGGQTRIMRRLSAAGANDFKRPNESRRREKTTTAEATCWRAISNRRRLLKSKRPDLLILRVVIQDRRSGLPRFLSGAW